MILASCFVIFMAVRAMLIIKLNESQNLKTFGSIDEYIGFLALLVIPAKLKERPKNAKMASAQTSLNKLRLYYWGIWGGVLLLIIALGIFQ